MANESWIADLLGYKHIAVGELGTNLPPRDRLWLKGVGVVVEDDIASSSTKVTVSGGGGEGGAGVAYKAPVRLATTTNIMLSGLFPIDGITPNDGDRILVRLNSVGAENGLYNASSVSWTRTEDADTGSEVAGMMLVPVQEGDSLGDHVFYLQSDEPFVIGASPLVFGDLTAGDAASVMGFDIDPASVSVLPDGVLGGKAGSPLGLAFRRVMNGDVASNAAIAVSKLGALPADNGRVLRVGAGLAAWSALTQGDLGEQVITPAALSGNLDNYSPSNWSTATVVCLSGEGRLSGLGPASAKRKILVNMGDGIIELESGSQTQSPPSNRLWTHGAMYMALAPGESVTVVFQGTAWMVVGSYFSPSSRRQVDLSNALEGGSWAVSKSPGLPPRWTCPVTSATELWINLPMSPNERISRVSARVEHGAALSGAKLSVRILDCQLSTYSQLASATGDTTSGVHDLDTGFFGEYNVRFYDEDRTLIYAVVENAPDVVNALYSIVRYV